MKHSVCPSGWNIQPVVYSALLWASLTLNCPAKDTTLAYLPPHEPDAATFLPPPPVLGSPEQLADLEEVESVYHHAPRADQEAAYSEKKFTVFNFAEAVGPYFTKENLPKTAEFFAHVASDAAAVTDTGKDYFKRPRPFMTDHTLENGPSLEKSFSYPSGHSTETMVIGLVLADLLPQQKDAILAHARLMGWHRVEIARHYPTDIYAGRVLALEIVRDLKQSPKFQADFAAAQAELAAAANH